jgi:hypothetical protein
MLFGKNFLIQAIFFLLTAKNIIVNVHTPSDRPNHLLVKCAAELINVRDLKMPNTLPAGMLLKNIFVNVQQVIRSIPDIKRQEE